MICTLWAGPGARLPFRHSLTYNATSALLRFSNMATAVNQPKSQITRVFFFLRYLSTCLCVLFLQSIWGTLMGSMQYVDLDIFNYDGMFNSPLIGTITILCVSVPLQVFCPFRSNTTSCCRPVAQRPGQGVAKAGLADAAAEEEGPPGLHQDPDAHGSFCWDQGRWETRQVQVLVGRFLTSLVSAGPEKWADQRPHGV